MRRRLPHVLRVRDYTLSIGSSVSYGFGREMVFVAVGWQVYDISRNPFYLGLVGLAEFLPLLLFALPAGALADRLPRKLIYMGSLAVDAVITMLLLVVSLNGANELWPFLVLSFASGCSAAVGNPAIRSMTPTLVPFELLPNAIALRSTVSQAVVVVGPAIGGVLFALGPEIVYGTAAVLMLIAVAFVVPMKLRAIEEPPFEVGGSRLESLLADPSRLGELGARGYSILAVHRGKNLLITDETARLLDPICRAEIERMQQAAELHTARQIRGLDPSYAHRAEASKRRPAGRSIGNGVQTTSMQPDILQRALVERMQFP